MQRPLLIASLVLGAGAFAAFGLIFSGALRPAQPVRGWSESLRQELALGLAERTTCQRPSTRDAIRLQDRISDRRIDEGVRAIIGPAGGAWFDRCDRGLSKYGIPPGEPEKLRRQVAQLRRLFRERGVERDVELVAVASSYGELMGAQERLGQPFERLLAAGLTSAGIDTARNAVVIDVARSVTEADRRALREAADRAPVDVIINPVDAQDLTLNLLE